VIPHGQTEAIRRLSPISVSESGDGDIVIELSGTHDGHGRSFGRIGVAPHPLTDGDADDPFVEREAGFLAQVMGETTGKRVAEAVQAHLNDGGSVADLRKRLAELRECTRRRAAMVARTETTRAWNGAQREQMASYAARTGRLAMKEWLSSRDDRVREEHAALDGTKIPIAEDFPNGLPAPGEPNCRCTMLYTFEEAP
jgi:SPP1 gp7 family putative phage head morphogenesis protein